MASSSKRVITKTYCEKWIYGPQVSDRNAKYGVGGPTWNALYNGCNAHIKDLYNPEITPTKILELLTGTQPRSDQLKQIVFKGLKESKDILDVLLIHAAFINALGACFINSSGALITRTGIITRQEERIAEVYKFLYEETEKILVDKNHISIFVSPDIFVYLSSPQLGRPPNITFIFTTLEIKKIYLINTENSVSYIHPINSDMRKCATNVSVDCTVHFAEIKDTLFKPLADVIACHCSFFKQKLEKTSSADTTLYNLANVDKISLGDYQHFMSKHQVNIPEQKPPILIRKYKDTDNTCDKKTYLSQLFEKVCMLAYKPYYVTPKTDTVEDIIAAAKTNYEIARFGTRGYSIGSISTIFQTPILQNNATNLKANVQVIFIIGDAGQQENIYLDFYAGPSTQFFTDVLKEIYENGIFVPTDTFFNNQRYELNTKFDIAKLEFYKNLPAALKTPELKSELTEHFFLVIGNIIHFAVANNLELPFKLSRIYIMKLFKIFDFTNIETLLKPENLKQQLLFISTYLLEKAPSTYTTEILKIFKDPKNLLSEDLISIFDDDLPGSKRGKGIRMNGYSTLVEESKNVHIYSEDKSQMFLNMIEYLCRTGLKHYFGDLNSDIPIIPRSFKLHPNLDMFFTGFEYTKNFRVPDVYRMNCIDFEASPFDIKMGAIRKVDLYLSGFGITHEVIKKALIPLIVIGQYNNYMSPLKLFNATGVFKTEYMQDSAEFRNKLFDIQTAENAGRVVNGTVAKVKMAFLLYRILLNKGNDIPKEFIAQYNQKFYNIPYDINTTALYGIMTNEDYHNEFVKLLLKAWTGTPTITHKEFKLTYNVQANKLPATHTCFNILDINRNYTSTSEMYKELVLLATEGTNFGEVLNGGSKKKK